MKLRLIRIFTHRSSPEDLLINAIRSFSVGKQGCSSPVKGGYSSTILSDDLNNLQSRTT